MEADRYTRQLSMLNTNLADSDHIVWWRASSLDAEGRVSEELLGNGLFTTRDKALIATRSLMFTSTPSVRFANRDWLSPAAFRKRSCP